MRTVTYKSVLWGVAVRLGLDPLINLQANQAAAITEYINSHVRQGWEYYPWPEMVVLERRVYREPWRADAAYAIGDEVWDEDSRCYYVAVQAGAGNPVTDEGYWTVQMQLRRYVALDQPGQVPIGEVLEVYDRDPRINGYAIRVPYTLGYEGLQLRVDAPNAVWVKFRLRPSEFTAELWRDDHAYSPGERVYLPDSGECYEATLAGTGRSPAAEPDYWARIQLPYVLAEYVKRAAYAEALREDGQSDKAVIEDERALSRLDDEVEKVVGQQGVQHWYGAALPTMK